MIPRKFRLLVAAAAVLSTILLPALAQGQTVPERIVLTLVDDPAHTVAVTWRTREPAAEAAAQLAPPIPKEDKAFVQSSPTSTSRYLHFDACAQTIPAVSEKVALHEGGHVYYHKAFIEGLEPSLAYAYRVGAGEHWSEWNVFETAPEASTPFRFIYMGDAQNDILSAWSPLMRASYRQVPGAAFYLFGGDLVGDGEEDADWEEWFQAAGWIIRSTPVLASPGNHEYYSDASDEKKLSWLWPAQFTFAQNGPESLRGEAWYLDYADARIVSLNSNEDLAVQAEWLKEALGGAKDKWTVVTFHHPVYSSGKDRDNPALRAAWTPIFEEYGADLVLMGHDHTYARTARLRGGEPAAEEEGGAVYLNSVSGPKMYPFNAAYQELFVRTGERTQFYQVVDVAPERLYVETRTLDAAVYDAFELRRTPQGVAYISHTPATPERRLND